MELQEKKKEAGVDSATSKVSPRRRIRAQRRIPQREKLGRFWLRIRNREEAQTRASSQSSWLPSPWIVGVAVVVLALVTALSVWKSNAHDSAGEDAAALAPTSSAQARARGAAEQPPVTNTTGAAPTAATDPQGTAETLTVHVVGAVKEPGLVTLPGGSRTAAAIKAAGGFSDNADSEQVNLAQPLVDGQQVLVLAKGSNAAASAGAKPSPLQLLNTGDAAALSELPGIGPALAERIIRDRQTNGPYRDISELTRVSGIGEKLVAKLH